MKSTIYYFSATGNTLYIAKIIADKLDANLLPMTSSMGTTCDSERIGFLFPTYFWGAPRTVVTFIRSLNITSKNPYIFVVSSCGGMAGGVLGFTETLFSERNLSLAYGVTIKSVANFIEAYNPKVLSASEISAQAKKAAMEAANQIMEGKHTRVPKNSFKDKWFYKIYTGHKLDKDSGFQTDESCTGCGICTRVCPNQNIVLKDGRPKFLHHCEHCTACIHWCPQEALQWKNSTRKRNRYHHPEINLKEIMSEMHCEYNPDGFRAE